MRLVAWNANFNNRRKRSFEDNLGILQAFHPDIAVLSESALPNDSLQRVVPLSNGNPGLVVAAIGEYTLEPATANANAPPEFGLLHVHGPAAFVLAAAWPRLRDGAKDYHRLLMQGLDLLRSEWTSGPAIMAGDFNSNSRVSGQASSHPRFVKAAKAAGLKSVYHHHAGEEHGAESVTTFVQGKIRPRRFHLDYCFVSDQLVAAATVTIPQTDVWLRRSDHYPVVLDIPDAAFRS
jgi:hypothetical protein